MAKYYRLLVLAPLLFLGCSPNNKPQIDGVFLTGKQPPSAVQKVELLQAFQASRNECLGTPNGAYTYPSFLKDYANPFKLRIWDEGHDIYNEGSAGGQLLKQIQGQNQLACAKIKKQAIPPARQKKLQDQFSFAYDFQPLSPGRYKKKRRYLRRTYGLWGILFDDGKEVRWFYPQDLLLKTIKFKEAFEGFCPRGQGPKECIKTLDGKLWTFRTFDFVGLPEKQSFLDVFRLGPVVPISDIQQKEIDRRLGFMRDWYLNNMTESGKMTYLYRPSLQKRSKTHNNMIRQWMTTLALFRLGKYLQDETLLQAAETNLQFNINEYVTIEEDKKIAYILFRKKAKLGAAAFGLMSVLASQTNPEKEKLISYFTKFILSLHQKDGSFHTFYKPAKRNDNHNFYPGEALLALMTLYDSNPQKYSHLLNTVGQAFQHYRKYFRDKSNPAFVPWHTMALYRYYQKTRNKEVADFIFEMNDFLIEIQNTPKAIKTPELDTLGRFYDPKKRKYGPPHASSTAIYSEGLADALRLASELKDTERMKNYAYAILWGFRSLFQLQFVPETTFYLADKKAVIGSIHTTVINLNTRVDNTQHATMAFLNLLSDPNISQMVLKKDGND